MPTDKRSPNFWNRTRAFEKVLYPGLPSHRDHAVAKKTMRGFGGLITFMIRDADWRATADIIDQVRIPRIGPSLGESNH